MTNSDTTKIRGYKGTFVINDATARTGLSATAIQVTADAVFSVLKIGGVDALASQIGTPASAVKPCVMTAPEGSVYTDITLTSGQVVIVKS